MDAKHADIVYTELVLHNEKKAVSHLLHKFRSQKAKEDKLDKVHALQKSLKKKADKKVLQHLSSVPRETIFSEGKDKYFKYRQSCGRGGEQGLEQELVTCHSDF